MTTTAPETFYPHLREVLDDRYAGLPDSAIEAAFAEAFGEGITPAEYESFFSSLGKAFNSALPVLSSVASGAASGAAAGSVAGPWGALGGALLGGVGGGLSHVKGPAGDVGRGIGSVVGLAGSMTGRGGGAGQGIAAAVSGGAGGSGGAGSAASALGAMLARPETMAALRALLAGRNTSVPIGSTGTAAPASAFAGLLSALSREAEAEAFDESQPSVVHGYLLDAYGRPVVDPADSDLRAARLLALLALGNSTRPRSPDDAFSEGLDEGFDNGLEALYEDSYAEAAYF